MDLVLTATLEQGAALGEALGRLGALMSGCIVGISPELEHSWVLETLRTERMRRKMVDQEDWRVQKRER